MKGDNFYKKIAAIAAQPPSDRRVALMHLHTDIVTLYLNTIRAMTMPDATRIGSDGRTLAQVVGHIAEWERFTMLALGEIIAGVRWPQMMHLSGYLEADGQVRAFTTVDAFNAYQAAKHAAWPWEHIQDLAIHTATTLQMLFSHPVLLSPERLEQTKAYHWRLPYEMHVTVPCGWYLWMVTLAHEVVEHAGDLGMVETC